MENVWITALMIEFGTPDNVDAFIWIIPNIISIIIRPYLIHIVHKTHEREQSELDMIYVFGVLAAGGCALVAISCFINSFVLRIVSCTLGWTFMDVGLELVDFFAGKLRIKLERVGYPSNEIAQKYS